MKDSSKVMALANSIRYQVKALENVIANSSNAYEIQEAEAQLEGIEELIEYYIEYGAIIREDNQ